MHWGKGFPITLINHIAIEEAIYVQPRRKIVLHSTVLGTSGTVAVSWAGLDVISREAERHSTNLTHNLYTFDHPTDALATITVETWFTEFVPIPSGGVAYYWVGFWEAFYNGVKLADKMSSAPFSHAWSTATPDFLAGPTWDHKTDVPKWNLFRCWFTGATWAEQPDFHPYRH